MNGNQSRQTAWLNWAQSPRDRGGLGLAPHQAAGLVGNLIHESGKDLNPWGPSGDNGTAWGTAQWRNERLAGLKQYAAANGLDYRSMEAQQGFMRHELDTSENRAWQALSSASTPEEAATAFNTKYERSADRTGNRERAARNLMSQFGDGSSPGALTSAYADTESNKSMPALSADNTMGSGALSSSSQNTGLLGFPVMSDNTYDSLMGMASSLAGISNADQAKALTAQQMAARKAATEQGTWSIHTFPNGQTAMVNSKNPSLMKMLPGNFAKPTEDEYAKAAKIASAKANQEYGDSIASAASGASDNQATVDELRRVLSNPNVYQGIGGDWVASARKLYANMGMGDPQAVSDADVAKALSNKLALQLVQNGGNKLLPGSFSDSDRKFVTQMSTSLDMSPAANQRMLDIYDRMNKRNAEAEAVRAKHLEANGGIYMPGFRKEIADLNKRWEQENKERDASVKSSPDAQTSKAQTNSFTSKSGKTINWSVH